jgi:hypothetical protein
MNPSLDTRLGFLAAVGVSAVLLVMLASVLVTAPSDVAPGTGMGTDEPAAEAPSAPPSTSLHPRDVGDTDAEAGWVGQLVRSEAAGFEIRVPRFWAIENRDDVVDARGDGTKLTIRVGTADGRLVTCERPARPWERCRDRNITNLDEFREAVAVGPPAGCDWCIPGGWPGRPDTLGGDEAWEIAFYGYEYPAHGSETAHYVMAIHDGRPYFLRFHTSAEGPQESRKALWSEILETFTFLP